MRKRNKNKKKYNDHMDESWLIPYSDLLTLLLALFIVIAATSKVDVAKYEQMSKVFNTVFEGGKGVLEYEQTNPTPIENIEIKEELKPEVVVDKETEDLTKLKAEVDKYIKEQQIGDKFNTILLPEGLKIIIKDIAFFASGSADIKNDSKQLARKFSNFLSQSNRTVTVSGYTDNVPMSNNEFSSNWDLSAKRAINFMLILLENKNLDPSKFSATGYGEYQSIAKNDTEEGKAKNRRVELFIIKNHPKNP